MSIERARLLDGKQVIVTFLVAKPLDYWNGRTSVGADDLTDRSNVDVRTLHPERQPG